jgi:hypothetical protein
MNGARFISKDRYQRSRRINWKNGHSRRLQQMCGDEKLFIGFDNRIERWVLARLCQRYIVENWGKREFTSEVKVPVIWKTWEEGVGGKGLGPMHPELPGFIMRCDRWRRAKELDEYDRMTLKREAWGRDTRDRDRRDRAKELFVPFQAMADSCVGTVSAKGAGSSPVSFLADAYKERGLNHGSSGVN